MYTREDMARAWEQGHIAGWIQGMDSDLRGGDNPYVEKTDD